MRMTNFLRTPIRAEHQARLRDLQVTEHPLTGDPQPGDPYYPQTLKISFKTDESEVQVAALWKGLMLFLADSTAYYPQNPSDVTPANFSGWSLVGDLILLTADFSLVEAFQTHISLIKQPPSIVRYSKVNLTQDFLFTTLYQARLPVRAIESGIVVNLDNTDTQWHQKYIMAFLQGRAGVWCSVDSNDPARDFTNNPMPSVALIAGMNNTLAVTCASRATKIPSPSTPSWFDRQGDYDDISGETLVHTSINNYQEEVSNPAHPIYSIIPLGAIISGATNAAFESSHLTSVLRTTIINQLTAVGPYRRIDIARPERPGREVSAYPQRPFPQYRINWKSDGNNEIHSLRLPINGHLYVQLSDGRYLFSSIPRSNSPDPSMKQTSNQLQLSVKQATRKYIDLPPETLMIDLIAGQSSSTVYAHLLEYDSKRVWAAFAGLGDCYVHLKAEAKARWNATSFKDPDKVPDWFIWPRQSAFMAKYAPIYGYIVASAGRHRLAPEFLHAVLMGEGTNRLLDENRDYYGVGYKSDQRIGGWANLGLDKIWDTIVDLGVAEYIDTSKFNRGVLTEVIEFVNPEDHSTSRTSDVIGWEAAIELVAAELHQRLDFMLKYLSMDFDSTTELQHRFLAYCRYNAGISNSKLAAEQMSELLQKWNEEQAERNWGKRRPDDALDRDFPALQRIRYNSLVRIAVAEWYEAAVVYR